MWYVSSAWQLNYTVSSYLFTTTNNMLFNDDRASDKTRSDMDEKDNMNWDKITNLAMYRTSFYSRRHRKLYMKKTSDLR